MVALFSREEMVLCVCSYEKMKIFLVGWSVFSVAEVPLAVSLKTLGLRDKQSGWRVSTVEWLLSWGEEDTGGAAAGQQAQSAPGCRGERCSLAQSPCTRAELLPGFART